MVSFCMFSLCFCVDNYCKTQSPFVVICGLIGWCEHFVRRSDVFHVRGYLRLNVILVILFLNLAISVIGGGIWFDLNPNVSLELLLPVSGSGPALER